MQCPVCHAANSVRTEVMYRQQVQTLTTSGRITVGALAGGDGGAMPGIGYTPGSTDRAITDLGQELAPPTPPRIGWFRRTPRDFEEQLERYRQAIVRWRREWFCPACGHRWVPDQEYDGVSEALPALPMNCSLTPRSWRTTMLLSIFFGPLGLDRFYLGKTGTGILKLLTGGGYCVWWIVDIILIATGRMKDSEGRPLARS